MADSTLKLFYFPLFLFFVCAGAQTIPPQFRNKCTVAENEHCFSNESTACRKGEHVNNEFTECTSRRRCCPCSKRTFQPYSNNCDSCIECKDCAKKNREVESPCNATHDAVCGEELPEAVLTTQTPDTTSHPGDQTTETAVTNPPSDQNDASVWCNPFFLIFTHALCAFIPLCAFIIYQNRSSIRDYMTRIRSNWGRRASLEEGLAPRNRRRRRRQSPGNRRGRQSN